MTYRMTLCGGPRDGETLVASRPFDRLTSTCGHDYRARCAGPDCLEWVDADTRRITLVYRGRVDPAHVLREPRP